MTGYGDCYSDGKPTVRELHCRQIALLEQKIKLQQQTIKKLKKQLKAKE